MLPSGSEPLPESVADRKTGKLIVWSGPALAVGGWLGGGGTLFTVTITSSEAVAPLSSVTVSLNVYVPADNPVMVVDAELGDPIVPPDPEILLQA